MKHIYIHWPFCKNKCHYCDFVAFEGHEGFEKQYHKALLKEISLYADQAQEKRTERSKIETIFLGGGTPSIYPLNLLCELFELLNKKFDLSELKETSIEVNPGGITSETLQTWKNLGINRLSIGVQVLNDEVLFRLNRRQTVKEFFELISIAPKYFNNISVDLILGLPGVTNEIWQNTLDTVCELPITHVSVYFLTIHENTPLFLKVKKREVKLDPDDKIVGLYRQTHDFLCSRGFLQYEISNFARPGFESAHNKAYWERRAYRGFGIGAASFDEKTRFSNIKNLSKYLEWERVSSNLNDLIGFSEILTQEQVNLELLMLGLRQNKGVDLHSMVYFGGEKNMGQVLDNIKILENRGLILVKEGRVFLTIDGMALENEVVIFVTQ